MINASPTTILFCATVSLISGIWIQSLFAYAILASLALFLSMCLYPYIVPRAYYYPTLNIIGATITIPFAIGTLLYWYQVYCFERFWRNTPSTFYTLEGVIRSIDQTEHLRTKQRITLDITQVNDREQRCHGTIYMYTNQLKNVRVADAIKITSPIQLKRPIDQQFTRYMLREGVYATAFCTNFTYTLINRPTVSLYRWITEWRAAVFTQLRNKIPKHSFSLFSALFLGNRSFNKKDTDPISLLFKRWGIAHVYARSGLHLSLLVGVWIMLMRLIPLSYRFKMLLLLSIGSLYALLSWSSISFTRALILFLLCYVCKLLHIPYKTIHLLTVTCICTLLYNPLHLFFLDFQLSFALTFALSAMHVAH